MSLYFCLEMLHLNGKFTGRKKASSLRMRLILLGFRYYYLITSLTVPAPTVRPPSRMENLVPFSIAMG